MQHVVDYPVDAFFSPPHQGVMMTTPSFTESLNLSSAERPSWKLAQGLVGAVRSLTFDSASVLSGYNVRYKAGAVPMTKLRYADAALGALVMATNSRSWLTVLRQRQSEPSTSPRFEDQSTRIVTTEFVVNSLLLLPTSITVLSGKSLGRSKYPLSRVGRASAAFDLSFMLLTATLAGRELYQRRDEWLPDLMLLVESVRPTRRSDYDPRSLEEILMATFSDPDYTGTVSEDIGEVIFRMIMEDVPGPNSRRG